MELIYKNIIKGTFISRPNRFVIWMEIDGKAVKAHMPNPGRMRELLFPGTVLYAVPHAKAGSATAVRVIGCERDGEVVPLDTTHANDVAEWLVNQGKIPGWENCHVVRREVTMGDSRFDLLLSNGSGEFPVEVKSCTLFGKKGAMFPDAVTARGRKHILHLGDIGKAGSRAGLLILVQWDRAEWFLPDYHTDPDFGAAFCEAAPYIEVKPAAIRWTADFSMPSSVKLLPVPLDAAEREMGNAGDYLIILYMEKDMDFLIGKKGMMHFQKGYYVYVGSAKKESRSAHRAPPPYPEENALAYGLPQKGNQMDGRHSHPHERRSGTRYSTCRGRHRGLVNSRLWLHRLRLQFAPLRLPPEPHAPSRLRI